ncbi:MAG: sulfatase family protein [Gammaproteobacteria bacterium]
MGNENTIDRRRAAKLLGSGVIGLALSPWLGARASRARARPNVVFIMTDDHAQNALGIYGNRILKTPNLDRIGNEGLRFQEAFVTNSLCLPSRATYLTGQYSHSHGMITNGEESGFTGEPKLRNEETWPNLLRRAGYHTAVVGKWHINSPPAGYDYTAVLPGQGQYFDPEMLINGAMTRQRGHADDVIGDQALAFLTNRHKDAPFCLLYQFKAPHRGWEPAPRFAKAFEDLEIPLPKTFFETLAARPQALQKSEMRIADMADFHERGVPATLPPEERARRNYQALVKNYYRVLLGVDENVGRVLELLDREGLAENTIVLYASDNGFFLGEHGLFDKRLMYEPSIRVPMLLRWPAGIERARVDREHIALNIDVAPTLLDLCGVQVPASMQGASWSPLLREKSSPWREDFLYEYYEFPAAHCVRPHRGVRGRRWKLIHFWHQPQEWELYDLQSDPDEMTNLAARPEHTGQLLRMQARLAELRRELDDIDPPGYVPTAPDPGRCPA